MQHLSVYTGKAIETNKMYARHQLLDCVLSYRKCVKYSPYFPTVSFVAVPEIKITPILKCYFEYLSEVGWSGI